MELNFLESSVATEPGFPIDKSRPFDCSSKDGEAISPRGDMPKNRVRFSTRTQHARSNPELLRQTRLCD
jgi:hypothetical protein